jgi:hypothetical protein|tara:strand:+ start:303 stop:515 length:213 start_codon:yes stop_codon:yes gene_type:complete
MMSLYDYLGKAAGSELGAKVAAYAQLRKQKFTQREIDTPAYTGAIQLYEKEFIKEYFKVETIFNNPLSLH